MNYIVRETRGQGSPQLTFSAVGANPASRRLHVL